VGILKLLCLNGSVGVKGGPNTGDMKLRMQVVPIKPGLGTVELRLGFKEYLNESLLVEAKVKVGGKEYASKKDAGIALAKLGKNAEQIEKVTGLSLAGAKWCIVQVKKGDNKPQANKDLKTQNQKMPMLDKLKAELKRAEDEAKKLGKRGGSENDAYVLTLKKKIKDAEDLTKKEPVKNKAQERREALEAYKKGEKHKPEALELAPLDRNKSKTKAKEWMKKHGDDHNKQKELKAIQKEMDKLAAEYDRLEDRERRLKNKGDISLIGAVEKRMDEIKKAMVRLNDKEAELK
jgi:unconventional prefoldin RPB5 interactor 1